MRVSAEYAQNHFDDLLDAADRGEEVEIERTDMPAVRMSSAVAEHAPLKEGLWGALKGQIWMADDFDSSEVNGAIADLFERSEL